MYGEKDDGIGELEFGGDFVVSSDPNDYNTETNHNNPNNVAYFDFQHHQQLTNNSSIDPQRGFHQQNSSTKMGAGSGSSPASHHSVISTDDFFLDRRVRSNSLFSALITESTNRLPLTTKESLNQNETTASDHEGTSETFGIHTFDSVVVSNNTNDDNNHDDNDDDDDVNMMSPNMPIGGGGGGIKLKLNSKKKKEVSTPTPTSQRQGRRSSVNSVGGIGASLEAAERKKREKEEAKEAKKQERLEKKMQKELLKKANKETNNKKKTPKKTNKSSTATDEDHHDNDEDDDNNNSTNDTDNTDKYHHIPGSGRPRSLSDPNLRTMIDPSTGLMSVERPSGWIGAYSPDSRKVRIDHFLSKRNHRVWIKTVKYDVRKNFADSRLRVKGRFVKKEDEMFMRELIGLT